jgi:hypothetical protein
VRLILKMILQEWGLRVWTRLVWCRTGTSGGTLCAVKKKMVGISWLAELLLASQNIPVIYFSQKTKVNALKDSGKYISRL